MKKEEEEKSYGKRLTIPFQIVITHIKGDIYTVDANMPQSPELQLAMHNAIQSYAQAILFREKRAKKGEKQLTKKQLSDVLSAIAYCNMVLSTQAPILWRDLKLEDIKIKEEEAKKKGTDKKLIVISGMGSLK